MTKSTEEKTFFDFFTFFFFLGCYGKSSVFLCFLSKDMTALFIVFLNYIAFSDNNGRLPVGV